MIKLGPNYGHHRSITHLDAESCPCPVDGRCPGHPDPDPETRPAPAPPGNGSNNKKGKGKKAMDSSEASKLVAARISQLELDAAGEKDQEAEIGAS
jgi:hypothetical protein